MLIQGRESTINSDGTISIKNSSGNIVVITGKVLGTTVKIENIQSTGSGYIVTANGMTMDILNADADKLISFVDTGSPTSIKRQNAGFLEPSISLIKVREINSQTNQVTNFDAPSTMTLGKKILIISLIAGGIYGAYRLLRVR